MKKLIALLAVALCAGSAFAQMDDATFSLSSITTNSDSASYVLRGEIEAINVIIPAGKTATVAVATSEATVFSASLTSSTDGIFYPRAQVTTTDGTASLTNAVLTKFVAAGTVTATVTPGVGATGTNSYTVKVIYKK